MVKSKIKTQRIGTFAEFLTEQKKQRIQENNEVAIDVPFYNDAVEGVFYQIQQLAGDPIDWGKLIDYIKIKFLVTGREVIEDYDGLVSAFVRDKLFDRCGDTILGGEFGGTTHSTAEMGTKALVISQLASDILSKVRVNAGLDFPPEPEPTQKPISTVSLDCYCDDEYYGESVLPRKVAGFSTFSNLVKESVDRLSVQHDEKAIDFCLKKLEKSAGSLKLDDIEKVLKKEDTNLIDYLTGIADEYLATATIELNGNALKNNGDEKIVLKQAKKLFAHEIAKELLEVIKKETL